VSPVVSRCLLWFIARFLLPARVPSELFPCVLSPNCWLMEDPPNLPVAPLPLPPPPQQGTKGALDGGPRDERGCGAQGPHRGRLHLL
jgi:hypothetical protein